MSLLVPAVAMLLTHVADEVVVSFDGSTETITMTADTLALLAPVDANGDGELTQGDLDARADAIRLGVWEQAKLEPCTRSGERATLQPGYVELKATLACTSKELSQEFKWLQVLPGNYRVVMGNQIARGDLRTLHFGETPGPAGAGASPVWWYAAIAAVLAGAGFWLVRRRRP